MRKLILTIMASLLSCSFVSAFLPEAMDSSLEVGVGYRCDTIKWKTEPSFYSYSSSSSSSGSGFPFGFRSELEWKNLNIWQIEAKGKYVTCDNIYLRANADYGWITSGKCRDRDSFVFGSDYGYDDSLYFSDNFSRSSSHTKGHVYDAKLAVGYQFSLCDDSFTIAPLIGYSWHGQHLQGKRHGYCSDSYYSYSDYSYSDYSSSDYYYFYSDSYSGYGHHGSSYHTRWNGPFIGFDAEYAFGCCCEWTLFGGYEFHWADFHAKADWGRRYDLYDGGFYHRAKNAWGNVLDIGVKWDFCECWTLALKGEFQWWYANHGRDRARINAESFGNVDVDCFVSMPVRDIRWQSASISIDVGMVF